MVDGDPPRAVHGMFIAFHHSLRSNVQPNTMRWLLMELNACTGRALTSRLKLLFHRIILARFGSTLFALSGFPWYLVLFLISPSLRFQAEAIPKGDVKILQPTDWSESGSKLQNFFQQSLALLRLAYSETKFVTSLWQTATYWESRTLSLWYPPLFLCVTLQVTSRQLHVVLLWRPGTLRGTICSEKQGTKS